MGIKVGNTKINGIKIINGGYSIDDVATGNFTGDIVITANTIKRGVFKNCTGITSIVADNVESLSSGRAEEIFYGCSGIITMSMKNVVSIGNSKNFAAGCTSLRYIHFPKLTDFGDGAFTNCTALTTVLFESATGGYRTFKGCTNLENVDYAGLTANASINVECFSGCSKMNKLIIRKDGVIALSNLNAFTSSPFASNGTGGTLYVPRAQISNYESATNWVTILGYQNNNITAIEDSIYATQYVDGTPIS